MYRGHLLLVPFLLQLLRGVCTAEKPIQVTKSSLTSFLETQDSDNGILMEFYANWCPTCQRFQPEYEKIGAYFNAEPRVQPSVVVARIDCATEVQNDGQAKHPSQLFFPLKLAGFFPENCTGTQA